VLVGVVMGLFDIQPYWQPTGIPGATNIYWHAFVDINTPFACNNKCQAGKLDMNVFMFTLLNADQAINVSLKLYMANSVPAAAAGLRLFAGLWGASLAAV